MRLTLFDSMNPSSFDNAANSPLELAVRIAVYPATSAITGKEDSNATLPPAVESRMLLLDRDFFDDLLAIINYVLQSIIDER